MIVALTDKERQTRGLDALGVALRPLVDERMGRAAHGKDWLPLYEAKEALRLGRPHRVDAADPRLLLRILRYERGVFTEVRPSQRAWMDELIQASNRAAHVPEVSHAEADRALDTMVLLAEWLELDDLVTELVSLRALPGTNDVTLMSPEPERDPEHLRLPKLADSDDDEVADPGERRLSVRTGPLHVVVQYREAVNFALVHNRVSPIVAITVTNDSESAVDGAELTLDIATPQQLVDTPIAAPLEVALGRLQPGATELAVSQFSWRLNPAGFVALEEAVLAEIRLKLSGQPSSVDTQATGDIRLLTADEWWALSIPESLAAFVRPNDPAIGRLLDDACGILEERTGSPSLEGYQSGAQRVSQIAEAIYDAMAARAITYVEAPASFEGTGQRIRRHAEVLDERRGTCLDLACTYAAALEQAGVFPVLAIAQGHAFVGYLTDASELPAIAVSDQGGIVTVADSDMFDALEITAVCAGESAVSFDSARGLVRRWWRADLNELTYLLDVRAAHRRVKPIPTVRIDGETRLVEVVREAALAPERRVPREPRPTANMPQDIPPRVQRWQRALLDMTYSNPLLKLKKSSSIPVHVPSDALARLEDKVADGQRIKLLAHDDLAEIHRAQGARTAADVGAEDLRRIMREEDTVFAALTERDYIRRLRDMQRKARLALEETGADSLYLALGTIEWNENGKEGRAPLFLAPIRLEGGRGGRPFYAVFDDTRSMEPNYCLVEKLRVTADLDLPELVDPGHDASGIDVENALAAVRSAILRSTLMTFHVEETAHLALVQFSTLEMWRDLRDNWRGFLERPVVKHLVETPGRPFLDGIEPPQDEDSAEATTYLPIVADGSQIRAVRWAAAGKSFILEGPPGTGKSQTITNLIAQCIAEGKKVLFVAEKQAALDVVKKRLDAVGLRELSIDLHGKNQGVNVVRQQISNAFELDVSGSPSWETLRSTYRMAVESLARYPKQLHEPGPVGMSAWEARQVLIELQGDSSITGAEIPRDVVMGGVTLEEVYEAARDLGNALLDLGMAPSNSPWRIVGPTSSGDLDWAGVATALRDLQDSEDALSGSPVHAMTSLASTQEEFDALGVWLDSVAAGIGRTTGEAAQIVDSAWRTNADHATKFLTQFRETQRSRLGPFAPAILDVDLDRFLQRSKEVDDRMLGKKKRRRAIIAELEPYAIAPMTIKPNQLTGAISDMISLRGQTREMAGRIATLPGVRLPQNWNPLDDSQVPALDRSIRGLELAARLREVFGASDQVSDVAGEILDRTTSETLAGVQRQITSQVVDRLATAWFGFTRMLNIEGPEVQAKLGSCSRGEAVSNHLPAWTADSSGGSFVGLHRWLRVRSAVEHVDALGLGSLASTALSDGIAGADVELHVRRGIAHAVLEERLDSTGLVRFDGRERARVVGRFIETGEDVRRQMIAELPARIVRSRTFDPNARVGMVADLRQQLGRRRGGLSVRRLLHQFAPIITQVVPCFLMSPGSVARFLPVGGIDFDVVVFDEASQIRVPDAIGAMARGRSVVIVGDSKQMPPSAMFASSDRDEDDEDQIDAEGLPVPIDLESILSEGVESRLPQLMLTWHYRSRDESLIAFSNNHYYEGSLSSFPTPPVEGRVPALSLRRVSGAWEGGARGARVNRAEAAAVVDEIQRRVATRPDQTLGVVTFNTQQRNLILNRLDEVRLVDAAVDDALSREDEPLFVKNLENVQGDERDVVLFTLAFAPDEHGRVPLNWGPLSRTGGERRLNVAVTRAKEEVVVFCSFDPNELDLSRTSSVGLADLKDYLLAARNGVEAVGLRRPAARDLHLDDIARSLSDAGLNVRTRVGLSDFTVDLAIRETPDKDWIAIMLDGPAWADRFSVGDRDGVPATVLKESMGWYEVLRIWLPTWVRDRTSLISAVVEAASGAPAQGRQLAEAGDRDGREDVGNVMVEEQFPVSRSSGDPEISLDEPTTTTAVAAAQVQTPIRSAAIASGPREKSKPHQYQRFSPASTGVRHEASILDASTGVAHRKIQEEISNVILNESPVLAERLARVVAARFGLSRVRGSRQAQILRFAPKETRAGNGDVVYWHAGTNSDSYSGFRVPSDEESKRDIADIPYHELRNAMVHVVRGAHSIDPDDALRETARLFDVVRLGANVRERLTGVLKSALAEGKLVERGGFIFTQ